MGVPFGRYVLERWLAQGGMANIFLATYAGPLGFEREVVLKIILPEYAHHAGFISMFLDEARLAARLTHPNIVQVHDLGQVGGYIFIAMEYVRGSSLSRMVTRARKENRVVSPQLAIFLVSELLEALSFAHTKRDREGQALGIVHRDVNPQNVMVSFDGQVKLTDFGVAKANVNLNENQSGVVIGKYSHMAPEQCLARGVDDRADVFAAGVMLHELLTGKQLFVRPTAAEMVKAITEDPVPMPSQVSERCPRELDLVVMKALARRVEDRYASSMAFLEALQMVARPLNLLATRYDLRHFMATVYRRGRNNLAGDEEPGMTVTEDRISDILRGIGGRQPKPERSDGGGSAGGLTSPQPVRKTNGGMTRPPPPVPPERLPTPMPPANRAIFPARVLVTPEPMGHPILDSRSSLPFALHEEPSDFPPDEGEDTISVHLEPETDALSNHPPQRRTPPPSDPLSPQVLEEPTNAWGELDLE